MTPEELLKPRFKVIEDYPDAIKNVGDIFTTYDNGMDYLTETSKYDVREFPHLFKKLKWWEERKIEEMPMFLKSVYHNKNQYVHKVETWIGVNSSGQPLYEYLNIKKALTIAYLSELTPATEDEYLEFCITLVKHPDRL